MQTPESIFEVSKQNYNQAQKIITEISEIVTAVQPDFDIGTARVCFDLIIQSCMLNAAAQDGELEGSEIDFIKNVTCYADILKLINAEVKQKQNSAFAGFEWEQVAGFNPEQLNKLAIAAAAIVDPYAQNLVSIFAIVDKIVDDIDYRKLLDDAVGAMFVGIAGIDGDDLDSENAVREGCFAFLIYDKMVDKKWKKIVEG